MLGFESKKRKEKRESLVVFRCLSFFELFVLLLPLSPSLSLLWVPRRPHLATAGAKSHLLLPLEERAAAAGAETEAAAATAATPAMTRARAATAAARTLLSRQPSPLRRPPPPLPTTPSPRCWEEAWHQHQHQHLGGRSSLPRPPPPRRRRRSLWGRPRLCSLRELRGQPATTASSWPPPRSTTPSPTRRTRSSA